MSVGGRGILWIPAFGSLPGLSMPVTFPPSTPVVTPKNVSRNCWISLDGQNYPQLIINALDNQLCFQCIYLTEYKKLNHYPVSLSRIKHGTGKDEEERHKIITNCTYNIFFPTYFTKSLCLYEYLIRGLSWFWKGGQSKGHYRLWFIHFTNQFLFVLEAGKKITFDIFIFYYSTFPWT